MRRIYYKFTSNFFYSLTVNVCMECFHVNISLIHRYCGQNIFRDFRFLHRKYATYYIKNKKHTHNLSSFHFDVVFIVVNISFEKVK